MRKKAGLMVEVVGERALLGGGGGGQLVGRVGTGHQIGIPTKTRFSMVVGGRGRLGDGEPLGTKHEGRARVSHRWDAKQSMKQSMQRSTILCEFFLQCFSLS